MVVPEPEQSVVEPGISNPGIAFLSGRSSRSRTNAMPSARASRTARKTSDTTRSRVADHRQLVADRRGDEPAAHHQPAHPRGATFETSERPIGLSINSPSEITM